MMEQQELDLKIQYYRDRVQSESSKLEQNYLDVDTVKSALENTTPGPWHWVVHDYSMATMQGPAEEWDHVCSVSPCGACRDRAKAAGEEWKWGRCQCPTEANADLMMMAPTLAKRYLELVAEVERLKRQPTYPIIHGDSLYQYDEGVFVWFDETGGVGGASNYIEEARAQMKRYAESMDADPRSGKD
jgi:hypothetical protein